MLGFPPQVGAEMKARAIKEVGAGEEPKYIAKPFGFYTPQQLSPHIALHNAIDNQTAAALKIPGAGTDKNVLINPDQDIIATFRGVNRPEDFPSIKTTEIANVSSVNMPTNIMDTTLPDVTENEPVDTQLRNSRFKGALNKIDWNTLKGGAAVATTGVFSMIDPLEAAVTGVTRSNVAGMVASETVRPTETGLDLEEKVAKAYNLNPQDVYGMREVDLQNLDRLYNERMQRQSEEQAETAAMASLAPVTASGNQMIEEMRSRTIRLRDLQNSLQQNKPQLDNGEPTSTLPQ